MNLFETGKDKGAILSDCRKYRYVLWRHWNWKSHANCVMFVGLNPSTADESTDDPTIKKCMGFAKKWDYGGMYMLNLYAFRATKPKVMAQADDPVGPDADEHFGYYRTRVGLVVACWGSIPTRYRPRLQWMTRIDTVREEVVKPLHCLGVTKDGSPKHPSRLGYDTELRLWR